MSKLSEKLKYMALGALIAVIGFMFGNMNNGTEAQSRTDVVDILTVQKLHVLEEIRLIDDDLLTPRVLIGRDENGGYVISYGLHPKNIASMGFFDKNGGSITVSAGNGTSTAQINANRDNSMGFGIGSAEGGARTFMAGGRLMMDGGNDKSSIVLAILQGKAFGYTADDFGKIKPFATE